MKLSRYILVEKNKNGNYILFSTITKAVVLFGEKEYTQLSDGFIPNDFTKDMISELLRKHIIVDDSLNEDNYVSFDINYDRLTTRTFTTFLALTTLCNFSCSYCYEKGLVDSYTKFDTFRTKELVDWYEKKVANGHYETVHIELYGGEPLLYFDDLKVFLDELDNRLASKNVNIELGMISNGYLMNRDKLLYLRDKGLQEVQITLDGLKEIHNKRRPLKNGDGTFDTIIKNIKENNDIGIRYVLRISFDNTNVNQINELLEFLSTNNIRNNVMIYFAPIHQTYQQLTDKCSFCSKAVIENDDIIIDNLISLYRSVKEKGYNVPYCYTNGPCMTISKDSCLVAPNGDLYKCVEMIGKESLCIGNALEDKYNSVYFDFVAAPALQECLREKCKYVTMCGGGCLMQAYMNQGKLDSRICNYDLMERANRELLRMNFDDK